MGLSHNVFLAAVRRAFLIRGHATTDHNSYLSMLPAKTGYSTFGSVGLVRDN